MPRAALPGARPRADVALKISLAGDAGVGKTSLIRRFVSDTFDETYLTTLGTKVSSRTFSLDDPRSPGTNLEGGAAVWDIMGNHDFRGLFKEAFHNLPQWYEIVASVAGQVPMVVLASKSDLSGPTSLKDKEIERLCRELRWPWLLTSAKTGDNVDAAFRRVAVEHLLASRKAPNVPSSA